MSGGPKELIDTLRLTDEQWAELADKIDRENPYEIGQRRYKRVSFRRLTQIAVAIQRPDKQWAAYVVRSRDLSTGGIGFIHGAYIHTGSLCRVILKDNHDQVVCLNGSVKRCELIDRNVHHVGVQFDEEIDLTDFVQNDDQKQVG